jgi:cell division protease FtsH
MAVHESGHAVAGCDLAPRTLSAISLRKTGDIEGITKVFGTGNHFSASDSRRRLVIKLAGRAAEEILLGQRTAGPGGGIRSDLATATRPAAAAPGLDSMTGLVWLGLPNEASLTSMLKDFPTLSVHIREIAPQASRDAIALIRRRASAVQELAAVLLQRQAFGGEEAEAIVARHTGEKFEDAR